MPLNSLFKDVDRRTAWLRVVILSACFFGMISSAPLWLNTRAFPLIPILPGFPTLPSPIDAIYFGLMLLTLIAAFRFYRLAVKIFLILGLFAFCEDQNRGQPWFYMYYVLLGVTLLPPSTALAAARIFVAAIYIWSGFQKCNARFFHTEPDLFLAPALHWHLPTFVLNIMRTIIGCTPFLEIGIGLAVWSKQLWRVAIAAVLLIHLGAVLLLGPTGSNYNLVVLPWNLAMIALMVVLFWRGRSGAGQPGEYDFTQNFTTLRTSAVASALIGIVVLLPALSFMGLWDSYFSFSLYAENSATANIFVTKEFAEHLPPNLRAQLKPYPGTFDPQYQGPYIFTYGVWCYQELHVPPIPEPRAFQVIFHSLRKYSRSPHDLRMIVGDRAGHVIFYEDEFHQVLKAK